jgi:hypothetical protein
MNEIKHIPTCYVGQPCYQPKADYVHRWSGWPGAYCLICFSDDPDELCLGDSCKCPCHQPMWDDYNKIMAEEAKGDK